MEQIQTLENSSVLYLLADPEMDNAYIARCLKLQKRRGSPDCFLFLNGQVAAIRKDQYSVLVLSKFNRVRKLAYKISKRDAP